MKSVGLPHNVVLNGSWIIFKDFFIPETDKDRSIIDANV